MKHAIITFIRPWIEDFSAYDHFAQPLGFLKLAHILQDLKFEVKYFDCLRHDSKQNPREQKICRPFREQIIKKPYIFDNIPRYYRRYGWDIQKLTTELTKNEPHDMFFITTGMTYWYPAVKTIVDKLRLVYPRIPVVLGGIYSTLCPDHARAVCNPDHLVIGDVNFGFFDWLSSYFGLHLNLQEISGDRTASWDLVPDTPYAVLATSRGCSRQCKYCAAPLISGRFTARTSDAVSEEIHEIIDGHGLRNIAIYDDDFGGGTPHHLNKTLHILKQFSGEVKFHLPNAIGIESINEENARLLKASGFNQPRLSMHHLDSWLGSDGFHPNILKIFEKAARALHKAGYHHGDISTYIIAGLPEQTTGMLMSACKQITNLGINPYLAQFSPIPGTSLGNQRLKELGYDHSGELLLTNNILSVYTHPGWEPDEYQDLVIGVRNMRVSAPR